MLAGDGRPAAPRALQCEALKEEACHAPICTAGDRVQKVRLVTTDPHWICFTCHVTVCGGKTHTAHGQS
jgi:hypothetical protein